MVGAGLTGLWTALFVKELDPRAEVVMLEREIAAYGASGRSAGMLSETVDHGHRLAIRRFGESEAGRLAALGIANVEEMIPWPPSRDRVRLRADRTSPRGARGSPAPGRAVR